MEGTSIGDLIVRIGGDANDLIKELKKADAGLDSFSKGVKTAHQVATALATATAAAGTAVFAFMAITTKAADEMVKMSQAAGLNVTAFSELAYAANLSGVSTEALSVSINKLNKNVAAAASGNGDAAEAFRQMHVSVRDANGQLKTADEMMAEMADKFAGYKDGAEKSALAMLVFGKAGAQMIPLLNQGAAGIAALRDEARKLGVSLDSETGKAAVEFHDDLERMEKAVQGVSNRLMAELLPVMGRLSSMLVESAKGTGQFKDEMATLARFIEGSGFTVFETLAIVGSDVAFVFKMIGGEVGVIAAQLARLAHGDREGARLIGEEWKRDSEQARKDLDAFQQHIMQVRTEATKPSGGEGGAMDMGIGLNEMLNSFKRAAPKVNTELRKEIEKLAKEANEAFAKAMASRSETSGGKGPLGSGLDMIEDAYDGVVQTVESRAATVMDVNARLAESLRNITMGEEENLGTRQDPEKDARLNYLREFTKSARQIEEEAFNTKKAQLLGLTDEELKIAGGRQKVLQQMEDEHQTQLRTIERRGIKTRTDWENASNKERVTDVMETLQDITQGVTQHNRLMFNLNKVSAISLAVLRAYEGISLTMSKYPYPLNIAMAAAHGVAAFAQVSSIMSTQFGEGHNAPSVAGTTPAAPVTPVAANHLNENTTIVQLQGGVDLYSSKAVRDLLGRVAENTRDGGRVVIDG